jgi:CheY-like chemotaxis protein
VIGSEEEKPPGGTETILMVDDEEAIRDLGIRLLGRAGYTVMTAACCREALEIYRDLGKSISLVLLDLVMPGMGGRQCLEELLTIDRNVKVVVASGYARGGERREMIELGAKAFVTKPFTADALLKAIRTVLDEGGRMKAEG